MEKKDYFKKELSYILNGKYLDNAKKLMLFIEVDKKNLNDLKKIISSIDKNAFMVINETKFVENGFFK